MSRKTIRLTLDPKSIEQAIKEVERYKAWVTRKTNELTERLATIGAREASIRFSAAPYDGTNDSEVSIEPIEGGYRVVAAGQAVCFIEFGAGVYYNAADSYPLSRPDGIVGIGEYGQGKGKRRRWGYYGDNPGTNGVVRQNVRNGKTVILTKGNPASMPMWYASREMHDNVLSIAREVFGSD